jgi:hypothetical protein
MEQYLLIFRDNTNTEVEYCSPVVDANPIKENKNQDPPDELFEDDLYVWNLLLLIEKKMD